MTMELEARQRFREKVCSILSGRSVTLNHLTRKLILEGYSRDVIPMALRGAGVHVDTEGWATLKPGPQQTRLSTEF